MRPASKPKRATVLAACLSCRKRKLRCDGQKPCAPCRHRSVDCEYTTRRGETERQAQQRVRDDEAHSAAQLQRLFQGIAGERDEQKALTIFRSIRAGFSPGALVRTLSSPLNDETLYASQRYVLQTSFLLSLAQSTASLHDIVTHVTEVLGPGFAFRLPAKAVYHALRDERVTPARLRELVDVANGTRVVRAPAHEPFYGGPPLWVPASPWTSLIEDDAVVSHLISLFFAFLNPYWYYVDEPAFVHGMRGKNPDAAYCSPLLVHAILSLASNFSEEPQAFAHADQLLTRGEHFHDEALRLWRHQHGRASITNVQALMILAVAHAVRGQDSPGLSLLGTATRLYEELSGAGRPDADETEARVREGLGLSLACIEASWHMFCYMPCRWSRDALGPSDAFFDRLSDAAVYWQPYPVDRRPMSYRWDLVQRARHELTRFVYEAAALITVDGAATRPDAVVSSLFDLTGRLDAWYRDLPRAIRYSRARATAAMVELHANCASVNMHILDCLRKKLTAAAPAELARGVDVAEMRSTIRGQTSRYALLVGDLARDYREMFGCKIILPFVFHGTGLASFRLLDILKDLPDAARDRGVGRDGTGRGESADVVMSEDEDDVVGILLSARGGHGDDVETIANDAPTGVLDRTLASVRPDRDDLLKALEECFRVLLGAAFQHLLARGITQSLHVVSLDWAIELPESFQRVLSLVANTSWDPSDLQRFDSSYPNYGFDVDTTGNGEERRMVSLAKRFRQEYPAGRAVNAEA